MREFGKQGGLMEDELSYLKYVEEQARRAAEFGIEAKIEGRWLVLE